MGCRQLAHLDSSKTRNRNEHGRNLKYCCCTGCTTVLIWWNVCTSIQVEPACYRVLVPLAAAAAGLLRLAMPQQQSW